MTEQAPLTAGTQAARARRPAAVALTGRTRRQFVLGMTGVLGAAFVAACSSATPQASTAPPTQAAPAGQPSGSNGQSAPGAQPAGAAAGSPKKGGELRVSGNLSTANATTPYDPHGAFTNPLNVIKSMMFEGLTEMQPDGTLAPGLAASWTTSPDGLVYSFKLQSGVTFHNGRAMGADDVVYSFGRIQDPATNHPTRSQYDVIARLEAPDPATVVVTLKSAYAPLLALLADVGSSIVPKEEVQKGNFALNPVGTGSFKFGGHVPDQSVTLDANAAYWRTGLPRLDRISIQVNADQQAGVLAFRAGQADFVYDAPGENFDTFRKDTNYDVYGATGQPTFAWLMLNDKKFAPFQDVRVRQAIYWALDRATLAATALPGLTDPLNAGFLPASHWAALKAPVYSPDPAKAQALLNDAGQTGLKFDVHALTSITHFPRAAQVLQQQLKPLGIDTNIILEESGAASTKKMQDGDFDAWLHGTAGTLDPDQQFAASFLPGGGRNYTKFDDPQVDELATRGRASTNQTERAQIYQDAQRRLADMGPIAFLYTYNKYDVTQKYVRGYAYNPQINQWKQLREVWLDK